MAKERTQEEILQEEAINAQRRQALIEAAKVRGGRGVNSGYAPESSVELHTWLTDIDTKKVEDIDGKIKLIALIKDLKTGNIDNKTWLINSLRLKLIFQFYDMGYSKTALAYAEDLLYDFASSNSLSGHLNELLLGFKAFFSGEGKGRQEQILGGS